MIKDSVPRFGIVSFSGKRGAWCWRDLPAGAKEPSSWRSEKTFRAMEPVGTHTQGCDSCPSLHSPTLTQKSAFGLLRKPFAQIQYYGDRKYRKIYMSEAIPTRKLLKVSWNHENGEKRMPSMYENPIRKWKGIRCWNWKRLNMCKNLEDIECRTDIHHAYLHTAQDILLSSFWIDTVGSCSWVCRTDCVHADAWADIHFSRDGKTAVAKEWSE